MKTICIDDFKEASFKDVYGYVMLLEGFQFEVQKKRVKGVDSAPDSKNWEGLFDYYRAAFAGQKLSDISTNFSYWVPPVDTLIPFRFIFDVPDRELLADVLYYIIQGYFDQDAQEWEPSFENQSTIFHHNAWTFNFDVACWGLVDIASDFLERV